MVENRVIDVLKALRQHFRVPLERVQPLQGDLSPVPAEKSFGYPTKISAIQRTVQRARRKRRFLEFSDTLTPPVCRSPRFMPRI
jgi:hypothetical protein